MVSQLKLLISLLILLQLNCFSYLFHVSKEQIKIILNRKKISELKENSKISQDTKDKLILVEKVREFSINEIYLNQKGGYIYFTELDRKQVGWNVSASYPLKFESFTWWFPFAGRVPYKGFFDIEKAKEEEKKLIELGLDTKIRIIGGYSTLGWFSDPILSPQLSITEDELVSLVIHELSHATVYFPGDSNFNESYANFVETIGTEIFYEKFDFEKLNSIKVKREQRKKESNLVISEVKKTAGKLKEAYQNKNLSDKEKLLEKEKIIEDYKNTIIKNKKIFKVFDEENFKKQKLNNENFIGILRYNSGTSFFSKKFEESKKNFKIFHEKIRELQKLTNEEREKFLNEG